MFNQYLVYTLIATVLTLAASGYYITTLHKKSGIDSRALAEYQIAIKNAAANARELVRSQEETLAILRSREIQISQVSSSYAIIRKELEKALKNESKDACANRAIPDDINSLLK